MKFNDNDIIDGKSIKELKKSFLNKRVLIVTPKVTSEDTVYQYQNRVGILNEIVDRPERNEIWFYIDNSNVYSVEYEDKKRSFLKLYITN